MTTYENHQITSQYKVDVAPFIDGAYEDSENEETKTIFNPATGLKSMDIPTGCEADVKKAVTSARKAFDDGHWRELPPSKKQKILLTFADLIDTSSDELDSLDGLDMGKPISTPMGAAHAANLMRYCANAIDKIFGELYTSDATTLVTQRRVPRGVVAAVVPWNFPTANAVLKIAPALAGGNCVVLKPSEYSSQSAIKLAQLAIEAGLPAGVLNIVPGLGESVGKPLALHMDVDMLTFTGSTIVGKLMMQYAGQSNMKLVHAECGGKSPQLVFADFADLDVVADNVTQNILLNQGQLCVAGSRLLVQKEIEQPLVDKITKRFKKIVAGDPLNPETTFGPLVNQQQMKKVLAYIASGQEQGAELICGGERLLQESGGYFVAPTLFRDVSPESKIAQEEIFGPVLSITTFSTPEEAVQLANSTVYGLAAYLWTTNISTGMQVAKNINSGVVVHGAAPIGEGAGIGLSVEPYGQSGVGLESGLAGMEAYLRRQFIWFNHG